MGRLIDVVRCSECIHYEDGECDMWEYDVVKPYEFCWYGQTADGRTSKEVDAVPVEWIEKYAETDDAAGSIFRMIEEWRKEDDGKKD